MNTKRIERVQLLFVVALGTLISANSHAENIRDIDNPTLLGTLAAEFFCDTFSFQDDAIELTASGAGFFLGGELIVGSSNLVAQVDPASTGTDFNSVAPVSVESGFFSMRGTNASLELNNDIILLGSVRSVDRNLSGTDFGFNFLIDLSYLNPALANAIGPAKSVRYSTSHEVWFGGQPWVDEIAPFQDCVRSSNPAIRLFAEDLPTPNSVTLRIEAEVDPLSTVCPFVETLDQTVAIEFTYDSNTRDLDPDPDVGRYLSCDDTYGASSGAIVTTGGFSHKVPCVMIVVENNSNNGTPGGDPTDLYIVSILGDSAISGMITRLEGPANSFADDSLPVGALPIAPPGSSNGFVTQGITPTALVLEHVCEINSSILRPTFTQLGDPDGDDLRGAQDNCLLVSNPGQRDSDGDGYGNACDADFNNDDIVNIVDLGFFRTQFFASGNQLADLNSDGMVNIVDLGRLRTLFFLPPGPSGLHQ